MMMIVMTLMISTKTMIMNDDSDDAADGITIIMMNDYIKKI